MSGCAPILRIVERSPVWFEHGFEAIAGSARRDDRLAVSAGSLSRLSLSCLDDRHTQQLGAARAQRRAETPQNVWLWLFLAMFEVGDRITA